MIKWNLSFIQKMCKHQPSKPEQCCSSSTGRYLTIGIKTYWYLSGSYSSYPGELGHRSKWWQCAWPSEMGWGVKRWQDFLKDWVMVGGGGSNQDSHSQCKN